MGWGSMGWGTVRWGGCGMGVHGVGVRGMGVHEMQGCGMGVRGVGVHGVGNCDMGGLWDGGPWSGGPLSLTVGGDELRGDEGRGAVPMSGDALRRRLPYKTTPPSRVPPTPPSYAPPTMSRGVTSDPAPPPPPLRTVPVLLPAAAAALRAQLEAAPGAAPMAIEEAAVAPIAQPGGPNTAPPRRHPYGSTALSPPPTHTPINTPPPPPHHPLTPLGSRPRSPVLEDGGAEGPPQHRQEVFGRTDAPTLRAPPRPPNLPLCLIHGAEPTDAQRPAVPKGQPGG